MKGDGKLCLNVKGSALEREKEGDEPARLDLVFTLSVSEIDEIDFSRPYNAEFRCVVEMKIEERKNRWRWEKIGFRSESWKE